MKLWEFVKRIDLTPWVIRLRVTQGFLFNVPLKGVSMRDDEAFVHESIQKAGGLIQVDNAIDLISAYLLGSYYESKNKRLAQWNPPKEEIRNLVVAIFTVALTTEFLTYQALVSRLNNSLPMKNTLDRIKTLAEITALVCQADLVDIERVMGKKGEYFVITPTLLLEGIPFVDRHATVYNRPQPVEGNWDMDQGSMLLGGPLNHHESNICLDHINRMNKIPMRLNEVFLLKYPEEPKSEKTVNTPKKKQNWDSFVSIGKQKYAHALVKDKNIYLNHKYCTRGRTYATGYYISTQGSSFKKASIQLANKELLNNK